MGGDVGRTIEDCDQIWMTQSAECVIMKRNFSSTLQQEG